MIFKFTTTYIISHLQPHLMALQVDFQHQNLLLVVGFILSPFQLSLQYLFRRKRRSGEIDKLHQTAQLLASTEDH